MNVQHHAWLAIFTACQQLRFGAGVIHGQTRILAGTLTVLEIFNGREQFKQHVQVTTSQADH